MSDWSDVAGLLKENVEEMELEDSYDDLDSSGSVYDEEAVFERTENDFEGSVYSLESERSGQEIVELLGSDFSVEVDVYPDVEKFGYSLDDDTFTLDTGDRVEKYGFGMEKSGFYAGVGNPFNSEIWEIFTEREGEVRGYNRTRDDVVDLTGSALDERLGLMTSTMDQVKSKIANKDSNIVMTSNYRQDVERLENGEQLATDSKKIQDADANLSLSNVTPMMAMEKPMSTGLNPLIQFKEKGVSLRALFIEGYRLESTEDDKVYGIALLDKNNGEQDELSDKIEDKNNGFFDDAKDYAEMVIDQDPKL